MQNISLISTPVQTPKFDRLLSNILLNWTYSHTKFILNIERLSFNIWHILNTILLFQPEPHFFLFKKKKKLFL